jgi:hypothetical protein
MLGVGKSGLQEALPFHTTRTWRKLAAQQAPAPAPSHQQERSADAACLLPGKR